VAAEVVMPRLGWTMETGTVVEWLKADGDAVRTGDIIFTVETDKAVHEVEALDSGILRVAPEFAATGVPIAVGAVLAHVFAPGDLASAASAVAPATAPSPPGNGVRPREATVSGAPATRAGEDLTAPHVEVAGQAASPRARRVARALGLDWAAATGTGRTGRIVERDVRALAEQPAAIRPARVTPLARRLAEETGVDLVQLAAQMPGQRIARAHVEAATIAAPIAAGEDGRRTPLSRVRRIIAARMVEGARTTAPVTLTTEADATELVELRTRLKQALTGGARATPSYNDLLTRLVALALLEHPALNCSWTEEGLLEHQDVHIGLAVDTEKGLCVPVIRDAQRKSLQQIAVESARLIAQTRAGKASSDDLRGSTFTITNLGMYDIDAFTPIINLPDCAILGVGRIVARPVVIDQASDRIAVRRMMTLSLTFDHRVVDGGPAARFLQQIKQWIEQPYAWLTA